MGWEGGTRPRVPDSGPCVDARRARARRLFGIKCAQCQVGFSSSDLVMRARDSVYHIECFRCSVCSRQLLPGDEFSLREHELLCRADHGLLLERAAAGSPRSPGPLPGARGGLHLPGKPLSGPAGLCRGRGMYEWVADRRRASDGKPVGKVACAGNPAMCLRVLGGKIICM